MVFFKKKIVKISSRALLRIRRKPNTFLTFLSKGLLRATFELLQQRLRACEGHHPLQKMTRGAHARGRRARTSKSCQTHCDFNNFKMRCQENI